MVALNLSTFFNQLAATSNFSSLKSFFLLFLALELSFRSDYVYPDNYITRSFPTYNPHPISVPIPQPSGGLLGDLFGGVIGTVNGLVTGILGSVTGVPDNACQRSINKSPLIFDFVVVGSGAAGSVVANRLSENPNVTVLLIEAGSGEPMESVIPLFFPFALNVTGKTWPYHAEVNQNASLAFNNGCPMQFGKTLGGTTSINAMLWVCGNDRDFNSWNASGATGWDYNSIFKYFKKIENNLDPSRIGKYHGNTGPLAISSNKLIDPFVTTIKTGWNQLGYKNIADYNSQTYNGITELQSTMKNGERENSYQGYLKPAKNRENLFFAYEALVTNVVFNGTTAVGVNVQTNNSDCPNIQFNARKEVILSAGAFGSTKILLQSGVGPKDQLKKLDIPVVQDLPVGKNFQDHATGVCWIKMNPDATAQNTSDVLVDALEYLMFRQGNDSQLGTTYATAFINLTDVSAKYPEVEFIPFRFPKNQAFMIEVLTNFGYTDDIIVKLLNINQKFELLMIFVTVLNPKSTGTVELRGKDPKLSPKITSGFFTDPDNYDRSTMSGGFLKVGELMKTDAWNKTKAEFIDFDLPLCQSIPFATRAYFDCYTRYFCGSEWHFTGVNRMGAVSDAASVVDPTLKVRGLDNLRVIDAGIMPFVPSGNSQCPTYVIGEKGSDMIKMKYNL